jgi:hypothetical protein
MIPYRIDSDTLAIGANIITEVVLTFDPSLRGLRGESFNLLGIERLDFGVSELGADLHLEFFWFVSHFCPDPVSAAHQGANFNPVPEGV